MGRKLAGVLAVLLVMVAAVFLANRRATVQNLQLPDRTFVELEAITYGTNHLVWHGNIFQKMLRPLPQERIPKRFLKGVEKGELNTPTNCLVAWLYLSGSSSEFWAGVTDTNGFGANLSTGLRSIFKGPGSALQPVIIAEWPRQAEKIALSFFENVEGVGRRSVGRLAFTNPSRQDAPPFMVSPAPPRATNGSLELALVSLDVRPKGATFQTRAGRHWACRARFQMAENGITNQDWAVQSLWLTDANGNQRRATGLREWNGEFFEIFSDPLWLDSPVWKLEIDLTRGANFRPEETVTFSNVPMPSAENKEDPAFQTNLLGHVITLRSMNKAKVRQHQMGLPGFALEIDTPGDDWVPKVVQICNEQGELIRVPPHGYGPGYALMRFSAKEGAPKLLRVTVTIQPRQKFTLFARPTVLDEQQ